MKLAAFVMTYRRPQTVVETVAAIMDQTRKPDLIGVFDNDPAAGAGEKLKAMFPGIHYAPMPGNLGPAGAAHHGLKWATESGADWVYWGDDDDPPSDPVTFARLLAMAESQPGVGAVAVRGARFNWRTGEKVRIKDESLSGTIEIDATGGNSQLIISRQAVEKVGLPDPELFFGWEDGEYCLRIGLAGFKLLADGDQALKERTASGRLGIVSKWDQRMSKIGSKRSWPARRYYDTRNYIYLMRGRFGRKDLARRETLKALARMPDSLRYGPGHAFRFSCLQMRGIVDGYRGRMGKTVDLR
jgi:glycosyltransferase involved in cell wall biosynthesis